VTENFLSALLIFAFLLCTAIAIPVHAHPGRTDSSGGHTCRTNCASWGYGQGEYHYHGGGRASGESTGSTYTAPVVETQQTQPVMIYPTNTPLPIRLPTRIPTRIPTSTPSPTLTLAPSPTIAPIRKVKPVKASTPAPKQPGFFDWLMRLFRGE
jgi:hypothetical protein